MSENVDRVMLLFGKAAYLGYMHSRYPAMAIPPLFETLTEDRQQAWVAAAHEAMSIKHIIQNFNPTDAA